MKCFHCGKDELRADTTQYFCKLNGHYIIIENVPCEKCDFCGETYFNVSVMEKIEKFLDEITDVSNEVIIADYNKAA